MITTLILMLLSFLLGVWFQAWRCSDMTIKETIDLIKEKWREFRT